MNNKTNPESKIAEIHREGKKMADKMVKFLVGKSKEFNEEERTDVGVISTITVDRDGEIMLPEGCNLENFRKNPVVQYAHDYQSLPIGKALWVKVNKDGIVAKTKYANTAFANDVWELKKWGFLNGFSVGFIPTEITDDPVEVKKIQEEYGISGDVNRVIKKWELLEYSVCNVPANPEAVTLMMKTVKTDTMRKFLKEVEEKGICGSAKLPIDEERAWDGNEAVIRARRWASSDGSGDKDKVDFEKYKIFFVWRDEADKENFGSYKLPFADVVDGNPTAIWRGVVAAMAAVLGARGGVDISEADRKEAYNFLSQYYKKLDREVPEYHQYTEGEVKALQEMLFSEKQEEQKTGAVLNKRNKENLTQAQKLIQEVLDSAEPITEESISAGEEKEQNKQKEDEEKKRQVEEEKQKEEEQKKKEEERKKEEEEREKEEEERVFNEIKEKLNKLNDRINYLTGKLD